MTDHQFQKLRDDIHRQLEAFTPANWPSPGGLSLDDFHRALARYSLPIKSLPSYDFKTGSPDIGRGAACALSLIVPLAAQYRRDGTWPHDRGRELVGEILRAVNDEDSHFFEDVQKAIFKEGKHRQELDAVTTEPKTYRSPAGSNAASLNVTMTTFTPADRGDGREQAKRAIVVLAVILKNPMPVYEKKVLFDFVKSHLVTDCSYESERKKFSKLLDHIGISYKSTTQPSA